MKKLYCFIISAIIFLGGCEAKKNQLFEAFEKNDYPRASILLNGMAQPILFQDFNSEGATLMHKAFESGNKKLIGLLLQKGCPLYLKDKDGNLPYSYAQDEQIKEYYYTLLNQYFCYACEKGNLFEVKAYLESGVDINYKYNNIGPPLHDGVRGNSLDVIKYLVKQGADIKQRGINNGTVLHSALLVSLKKDTTALVKYFLSIGVDPNETDWNEETPLFYETPFGNITQALINAGVSLNTSNNQGQYQIHRLINDIAIESVRCLIEGGDNVNRLDRDFNTPLHYAGGYNGRDGLVVSLLIEYGANINLKNRWGLTPLHVASSGINETGSSLPEALNTNENEKAFGVKKFFASMKKEHEEEALVFKIDKSESE